MNTRHHNAWMICGGGLELINDFMRDYNIVFVPGLHTGAQMGGWFRKEIKTLEDLKGLKFRIAGFAGQILTKLGAVPQQIAGGDIYPALEKGTIDAAEWVGPYDDEKLGFVKVAKYYYYPGWWEGCTQSGFFISVKEWEKLPPGYRAAINAVASEVMNWSLAKYNSGNPAALRRLIAAGAELRAFPREMMAACYDIALDQYEELAAKNPKFKKIYDRGNRSATSSTCGRGSPRTRSTISSTRSKRPRSVDDRPWRGVPRRFSLPVGLDHDGFGWPSRAHHAW